MAAGRGGVAAGRGGVAVGRGGVVVGRGGGAKQCVAASDENFLCVLKKIVYLQDGIVRVKRVGDIYNRLKEQKI